MRPHFVSSHSIPKKASLFGNHWLKEGTPFMCCWLTKCTQLLWLITTFWWENSLWKLTFTKKYLYLKALYCSILSLFRNALCLMIFIGIGSIIVLYWGGRRHTTWNDFFPLYLMWDSMRELLSDRSRQVWSLTQWFVVTFPHLMVWNQVKCLICLAFVSV